MEEIKDGNRIWNPRIKEWIDLSEIPEFFGGKPEDFVPFAPIRAKILERMRRNKAKRQQVKMITGKEQNISAE